MSKSQKWVPVKTLYMSEVAIVMVISFGRALSLSRVLWKSTYSRSNMKPKSSPKQARAWIEELLCWFQLLLQHFMPLFSFICMHVPSISLHLRAFSFHFAFISFHFMFLSLVLIFIYFPFIIFSCLFQCSFMFSSHFFLSNLHASRYHKRHIINHHWGKSRQASSFSGPVFYPEDTFAVCTLGQRILFLKDSCSSGYWAISGLGILSW